MCIHTKTHANDASAPPIGLYLKAGVRERVSPPLREMHAQWHCKRKP